VADKAAMQRFVSAASAGKNADFALHWRSCSHDDLRLFIYTNQVRVKHCHPTQGVGNNIVRPVNQLFHGFSFSL
jgi:hypothetical protein